MDHTQKSEAPTSVRVGHALARGGTVPTRRAVTDGGEAGEGKEEARR